MAGPNATVPGARHGPAAAACAAGGSVGESTSDSALAAQVKALLAAGNLSGARERFGELIRLHQRRASRIAYAYLRNAADADEAVQDAFLRVYTSIGTYREELPFGQWFTRILVNGCIDRHRMRQRREFRLVESGTDPLARVASPAESPEGHLAARQWRAAVAEAVRQLPERQRMVFTLCHYGDRNAAEVGAILGLRESTVRVHLFRAVHKLRTALEAWREAR